MPGNAATVLHSVGLEPTSHHKSSQIHYKPQHITIQYALDMLLTWNHYLIDY